jgi:hypothetical protein
MSKVTPVLSERMFSKPQIPAAGAAGAAVSWRSGSAAGAGSAAVSWRARGPSVKSWRESSSFLTEHKLLRKVLKLCREGILSIRRESLLNKPKNADIVRHLPFHAHKYLYSFFELKEGVLCLCGVPIYLGVLPFLQDYLAESERNKKGTILNPCFRFVFFLDNTTGSKKVTMFYYADPKEADDIEKAEQDSAEFLLAHQSRVLARAGKGRFSQKELCCCA